MASKPKKPNKNSTTPKSRKHKTPQSDPKHIFIKPTTKNQRLWNKEVERILRFQSKYKGIQVDLPEKPNRVTKEELKEVSGLRGRKILERATVDITETSDFYPEMNAGRIKASEFYKKVAGDRPLSKGGGSALIRSLSMERNARKANIDESDEVKQTTKEEFNVDTEFIDNPEYKFTTGDMLNVDDVTIAEFRDAYQHYRPSFRELMDDWLESMAKTLGNEQNLARYLRQHVNIYGGITRNEAYNEEAYRLWENKFVESLPTTSELRKRGEIYLGEEYETDTINEDAYEEIQAMGYMHEDYITVAFPKFNE